MEPEITLGLSELEKLLKRFVLSSYKPLSAWAQDSDSLLDLSLQYRYKQRGGGVEGQEESIVVGRLNLTKAEFLKFALAQS